MSEHQDSPPTPPHEGNDKLPAPSVEITQNISTDPSYDSNLHSSTPSRAPMSNASERAKALSDSNADPQTHVRALFYSLIYWDSPVKSGIALASILGGLIVSSLVSPIRLISALWSFAIFANLLFVHATLQYKRFTGQPSTNPHESAIKITHDGVLKKGKIDRWVTLGVDFVNLAAQSAGKIVLVEDTHRSLSWFGWGLLVYFISGFLPTRWILGLGVTFAFSLPKFYSENQALVDEQVSKVNVIVRDQLDKAQALAQQHAGPYIEKATELGQQYGLVHKQKNE